MSISYTLDDGILSYTTIGDVEYSEGLATLRHGLEAASSQGRSWHLLFDVRQSTEQRSGNDMRGIALKIGAHRSILSGRCVVIVAGPLHYGLGRVFGAYMESMNLAVGVFHEVEPARRWLKGEVGD